MRPPELSSMVRFALGVLASISRYVTPAITKDVDMAFSTRPSLDPHMISPS